MVIYLSYVPTASRLPFFDRLQLLQLLQVNMIILFNIEDGL